MFFTLSREKDSRLPYHDACGSWWLSHDDGWYSTVMGKETRWTKGYSLGQYEESSLGNFIIISQEDDIVTVQHGRHRSFPLWWDDQKLVLTSLLGKGKPVHADKKVVLMRNWLFTESVDRHSPIDTSPLSSDQAFTKLVGLLDPEVCLPPRVEKFSPYIKLFVTGGMDTVTILSTVKNISHHIEILDHEYFQHDKFTVQNISALQEQHWGYGQIHHWTSGAILVSGAYGDEYMMRGPNTVALWCAWHDINLLDILRKSTGYHVDYYLRPKNAAIFQDAYNQRDKIRAQYPTYGDLVWQILDIHANDHQHWHLGKTLTWTPFLNAELTKTILRLPVDDLIDHFIDATINRKLIEYHWPECLKLLSTSKNSNSRENLHQLPKIYQ